MKGRPRQKSYSIAQLKNSLSSVVAEVKAGYEAVVTDHNRPVARIVPITRLPPLPKRGMAGILKNTPVPVSKRPRISSTELIRRMRDED